jgi:hypothetical protein
MVKFLHRSFCAVFATLMFVLIMGPSAMAHSAAGSPSSNYQTTINSILPKPTTFSVRSIEQGSRLEVRWLSGEPLVIRGYDDEPYLRIGANGTSENTLSGATYINRDRNGTTAPPDWVDPEAAPKWRVVSSAKVARFHDHRAHYMGSVPPENVEKNRSLRQVIQTFDIPIEQGASTYLATGIVEWIPGPSPAKTLAWSAVVALSLVAVAVWAGRVVDRRKKIRPLMISALMALVAVDVVHLFGIVGGVQGGTFLGRLFSIGYASIAAWVLAIVSAVLWARDRTDALYLTTFAAGLMTLVGGVADLSILSRSAIVFKWSTDIARTAVGLTLGLGAGLVIAGVLLTRPIPLGVGPAELLVDVDHE